MSDGAPSSIFGMSRNGICDPELTSVAEVTNSLVAECSQMFQQQCMLYFIYFRREICHVAALSGTAQDCTA